MDIESQFSITLLAKAGLIDYDYTPMKPSEPLQDALSAQPLRDALSARYPHLTPAEVEEVASIDIDEFLSNNRSLVSEKDALRTTAFIALWDRIKAEGKVPEWAK